MPELRAELIRQATRVHEKSISRHLRLPVDRAFSMRGFGTVVTGTLVAGADHRGAGSGSVPRTQAIRVRGIQVHGADGERAPAPGQRTALNLAGADAAELTRGMILAEPGRFHTVKRIDCRFELLASAKPLAELCACSFSRGHGGDRGEDSIGRLCVDVPKEIPVGKSFVRIDLREPLLLLPGDRFIVRMFSPVVTIGGGVVLDIEPPRRSSSERLSILENGSDKERLTLLVSESKFGMGMGNWWPAQAFWSRKF